VPRARRWQFEAEDLERLEHLAYLGATDREIVTAFGGPNDQWLRNQIQAEPEVREAYARGRTRGKVELREALMSMATGDPGDEDGKGARAPDVKALIFACQAIGGMSTKQEIEHTVPALEDPDRARAVRDALAAKLGEIAALDGE